MINDRDMYYGSYGYGGFIPIQPNTNQIQNPIPYSPQMNNTPNTYTNSQFNDINERINRLERQVKRLDQRLTRIETPYANTNNQLNNEPDNNMYMM